MKSTKQLKSVYILVVKDNNVENMEGISTVASTDINSLIDYVVNEELPEQGYSLDDIFDMEVEIDLSEHMYWKDVDKNIEYSINESRMI